MYLGAGKAHETEGTCVRYEGELRIYAGDGASSAPFFDESALLLSQNVISTDCRCTSQARPGFLSFALTYTSPIRTLTFITHPHTHTLTHTHTIPLHYI
jgi:hypothetical protein